MLRGIQVSSGGARGVWMRNDLLTRHHRLLRLEETVRKRKIKLSEEQIRALERFDPEYRERHIEVNATGELVAVDTFFAGTLKGVGKVYIQTARSSKSISGGVRRRPLLGSGDPGARSRSEAGSAGLREAVRQAKQERRGRR